MSSGKKKKEERKEIPKAHSSKITNIFDVL